MKHLQTTIFLVPALSSRGSRLSFRMATVHLFIFWGKLFYDPLIFFVVTVFLFLSFRVNNLFGI